MKNKRKPKTKKTTKKTKKGKTKKITKRKPRKKQTGLTKSKMVLTASPLAQKQLLHILQKTPERYIYTRPAKGGGEWEYVPGAYMKKVLNYVFGWLWDFEVMEHGREGDLIWVLGKLTIQLKGNKKIVKTQFGRADVKFKKGTKTLLDYGNDLKAAATDALKKCASELGIASDIYNRNEFKDIQKEDKSFKVEENHKPEPKKEKKPVGQSNVEKLKKMLRGKTDKEKLTCLVNLTKIKPGDFNITEKHASMLIGEVLKAQAKNHVKRTKKS